MRPRSSFPWGFVICAVSLTACTPVSGTLTEKRDKGYAERCKAAPRLIASTHAPRRDRPTPLTETTVEGFSRESLAFAELLDVAPLLGQIPLTETEAEEKRVGAAQRLLSLRQEILQAVLMATLEASSAAAEVRCEQARADRLADDLEKRRNRRYTRLTLTAIILTALTSVVTGGLTLSGHAVADGVVAVTGGAFGGLFGGLALLDSDERPFHHPRNHLKEIWTGPDESEVFPSSIWRFLNRRDADPDARSLREQLVKDWRGKGRLGDPNSDDEQKRLALLFGEGGSYGIDDLRARTEMLDEWGTTIDLFYEDLERFTRESIILRSSVIE